LDDITKTYTNGDITIVWKPAMCIHSTICWKGAGGLADVFNPRERPWVKPFGAATERIIEQINKCPSWALSYFKNKETEEQKQEAKQTTVEVLSNGPLLIHGDITVKDRDGNETARDKVTAFCRCGASGNKPYCDGNHTKIDFQG
jgi:uncharacterized Fe-S cluster protein YjdI